VEGEATAGEGVLVPTGGVVLAEGYWPSPLVRAFAWGAGVVVGVTGVLRAEPQYSRCSDTPTLSSTAPAEVVMVRCVNFTLVGKRRISSQGGAGVVSLMHVLSNTTALVLLSRSPAAGGAGNGAGLVQEIGDRCWSSVLIAVKSNSRLPCRQFHSSEASDKLMS
jgi:hypothetical protein